MRFEVTMCLRWIFHITTIPMALMTVAIYIHPHISVIMITVCHDTTDHNHCKYSIWVTNQKSCIVHILYVFCTYQWVHQSLFCAFWTGIINHCWSSLKQKKRLWNISYHANKVRAGSSLSYIYIYYIYIYHWYMLGVIFLLHYTLEFCLSYI